MVSGRGATTESKEITQLETFERWLATDFEKWLAVTEDPLELKKGSDAIEIIRQMATRRHYDRELCNRMFFAGAQVDRKRGRWIRENIPWGGQNKASSTSTTSLDDINTSKDESSYCQRLLQLTEQEIQTYVGRLDDRDEYCSRGSLKRQGMGPRDDKEYKQPNLPEGIFQVVYADPPWQYQNSGFANAAQGLYKTMCTEEICSWVSSISRITNEISILFLWATNPMLLDALTVMREWGFEYKTNMVWVKDRPRGRGWFLISQHELILIGVKPKTLKPAKRVPSVIFADRGEVHSRKPVEAFDAIERMYPVNLSQAIHLEVFARESDRPGWIHYGDEV